MSKYTTTDRTALMNDRIEFLTDAINEIVSTIDLLNKRVNKLYEAAQLLRNMSDLNRDSINLIHTRMMGGTRDV